MAITKRWGLTYNDSIVVGEHRISLPALPKNRSEILFIDNEYETASWNITNDKDRIIGTRRQKFPDIWYGYMPYESGSDQRKIKATER